MNTALNKGKATDGHLNRWEIELLEYLFARPEYTATLSEIQVLWEDGSKYKDGQSLAYRKAQNSTRKLIRLQCLWRTAKGTYTICWPNRARNKIILSKRFAAAQAKVFTAAELEALLEASGNYPTKAARARAVGIEARRWSRLVAGTEATATEQEAIQACVREQGFDKSDAAGTTA